MYRSRVTILRFTYSQDETGGLIVVPVTQWDKWAKVENRTGSIAADRLQRDWNYDYKITLRFEKSRQERSSDYVVYDDKLLQIKELVFVGEGIKRNVVLRCATVAEDYTSEGYASLGILVYNYTSEDGGETSFNATELSGKRIISASKDGIRFTVYTIAEKATPETGKKQMVYDTIGNTYWSVPFEPGEDAIIQYV